MDLNHLHLHVRDISRVRQFYETYFGFRREILKEDDFLIVRNSSGFDLAFMQDPNPATMPRWFHFGFRFSSRRAVQGLHDRMAGEGVNVLRPVKDHGSWMSFKCADPDGYAVEVYYE